MIKKLLRRLNKKSMKSAFETLLASLVKLTQRTRPMMIFESHSDFCDNAKSLFDHFMMLGLNQTHEMVWLVEHPENFRAFSWPNVRFVGINQNQKAGYLAGELQRAVLFARCSHSFFSHRNLAKCRPKKNQVFFNLTHGTPLKDSTGKHNRRDRSSDILTTSEFAGKLRTQTYGGGQEQLRILGFPRNDLLFQSVSLEALIPLTGRSESKLIIWMPTFRRQKDKDRNDTGTSRRSDIPVLETLEQWQELNAALAELKTVLIVKPHPAQNMEFVLQLDMPQIKLITNETLQAARIDLYHMLGRSDALITDYSSVYMDYLNLDRPIGFTVDDLDEYTRHLGFLVDNPLDYMPGEKIKNVADLIDFARQVATGEDPWQDERRRINALFNRYSDDQSCKRISDYLGLHRTVAAGNAIQKEGQP